MSYKWICFILLNLLITSLGFAQISRQIKVEWEESPSAANYEIEFKNQKGEIQIFETQTANWKGSLPTNQYTFRVRAKDRRGVAGPWAPEEKLIVKVSNTNGAEVFNKELTAKSLELDLSVGNRYRGNVTAITSTGTSSDAVDAYFNLISTMSARPKLEVPKNQFVRALRWQVGKIADSVDITIYRVNPESGNDEIISPTQNFLQNLDEMSFLAEWPGGQYKAVIYAKKNGKIISTKDQIVFEAVNGDRTPASETQFYAEQFLGRKGRSFCTFKLYSLAN